MHSSASAPCLTRRPLLKGGTALLGLDYEETLQILRHQQRVENMKPSAAVQRQEQERNFQRHRRFVQIRSRYAQPTSPAPAHSSGRLPESGNRRDFEKRLERMLLQDWDGKEQDFAWKRCPPKEQRVPISRPRVREVAQGAEASAVSEAVPASESMTEPNETQRSEAARNETSDMQQGKGLEKDDTLKQKEAEAQVTNSYAGFGNPGASGGAKPGHLRPPDFRSILQSDNASSGPGASLDSGGNGLGGFGADAGMNLKPPNFQMQTDTSSALNAGAAIPSLSQQNDFASGPALKPLHSADEVPESIGGFGEQAAGGVGGGGLSRERRMRPPDFRSILQSDNASSGPSEPVPFGNQGNDGGLVLKPLGSLNGGGNGLGGLGADAGMNLKPSNFQMQTDTSSALNAGAAIPSLSQQNDFASGPALKPLHSADEVPESIGGFGSDFAGPGAIKSTAGPVSDFFKEENGYVPSVAAAGRRRRPRAGQL